MRSHRAWKHRPSGCVAAAHSRFWSCRTSAGARWRPSGQLGWAGPSHALARSAAPGVTEVGALASRRVAHGDQRSYDPVGLPLASVELHRWRIPTVFADEAGKGDGPLLFRIHCAYVPLPVP